MASIADQQSGPNHQAGQNAAGASGQKWTGERSAAGSRNPWTLVGVISLATLMTVLDATIVTVSLGHIAGALGTTYRSATWVLTAFLIANAVVIPISSWLSDVIGRKRYYMLSVAGFTLASFLCAFAPSLLILVLLRIVQGVAGGGLAVSEQSMLADTFPPAKLGSAFAAYALVIVVGPVLGPTIGGYITDTLSWEWIFLINVPIGIVSLLLVGRYVVEADVLVRERKQRLARGVSVDFIGLVLVSIGLGGLTYILAEGQQDSWFADPTIAWLSVATAVSLVALVWWELRHPDPIVRLRLLANRQFAIVILIIFMVGVIMFGTTQVIPQMFQQVFGYDAFTAGLALTLGGFGLVVVMPIAGRLATRVDPRLLVIPAFAILALGLWHFATLTTQASFTNLAVARLYQIFALPFIFVTINTIAYVGLDPSESGDASALLNVFRNIGGSVGISIAQVVLWNGIQTHQSILTNNINLLNPNVRDFLAQVGLAGHDASVAAAALYGNIAKQALFLAYLDVYNFVALLIIAVIPLCFLLKPAGQGRGNLALG